MDCKCTFDSDFTVSYESAATLARIKLLKPKLKQSKN